MAVLCPLPTVLRPLGAEQEQEGTAELAGETELQQPPQVPPLQEGVVRQVQPGLQPGGRQGEGGGDPGPGEL